MKKEELFRQCVLCDIEAQGYKDGAEYNLRIAQAVIEKKGWHADYVGWLEEQDCRQYKRRSPFPVDQVIGMLD